ncbi:MAG: hypothetical protein MZW92_12500 [Comamonadaceae bacterium]|nr:hypothetical protein [Comamonadaceae bacterium]
MKRASETSISAIDRKRITPAISNAASPNGGAGATYRLGFQGYQFEIDLEALSFDADATVAAIVRDQANLAVFILSEASRNAILAGIESMFSAGVTAHFDSDAFLADLIGDASHLYQIKTYRLGDYLSAASADTVLAEIVLDGLAAGDVTAIVAAAGLIDVPAAGPLLAFGKVRRDGPRQRATVDPRLRLASDHRRDPVSILPVSHPAPSCRLGRRSASDVRILRANGLDFSFYNPMDFGYRFVVTAIDATSFRIALVGLPFVETIESVWERAAVVPFAVETIEDLTLDGSTPGVIVIDSDEETVYRVVVRAGIDGAIWFQNRTVTAPGAAPVVERVAIDERPSVAAIYRENTVPKGGD